MPTAMIELGDFHARLAAGERPVCAVRFAASNEIAASSEDRTLSFVFSDDSVDRYGDTIDARGWQLDDFKNNPVALFGHDATKPESVVGRAKNVRVQGNKLLGDIEFADADVNPTADVVYKMIKAGFLKTVSVGFQPVEWVSCKDKSRPGGVDFKKQTLLEISIVPLPANPNALIQAKAAGIEVERLGIASTVHGRAVMPADAPTVRNAPPMTRKGLYSVGFLASILADLGYLQDSVAWEAEYEGDGSPVPAALMDAMKTLGQILIDMTAEEVAELVAGEDDDALGDIIGMSLDAARTKLVGKIARLDLAQTLGLLVVARDLGAGRIVQVKTADKPFASIVRQGKVISAANEKKLREAHEHMTAACECVKSVFDPPDDADPEQGTGEDYPTNTSDEAKALRARKAAALKRKLTVV